MRRGRVGPARSTGATVLLVAAVGLVGCTSSSPGVDASARPAPPSLTVPLDTTLATGTGTVAVVPMGELSDPLNTFWEVFFRSDTTSKWTPVTPPGVADNGGVVVSAGPDPSRGAVASLLVGFEPSQALAFSPLALSVDDGGSWSTGLVEGGLAAVPDALSASRSSVSGSVALVRNGGGEVLESTGSSSIGSKLAGRDAIASSSAGRSCGVGALTAVAFDAIMGPLVGSTCSSSGMVGIFGLVDGAWRLVGPRLSGRTESAPTKVLRLVDIDGTVNGLVAVGDEPKTSLIGVASSADGAWTRSVPLLLGPDVRIVSTSIEPGGGFVVLSTGSRGKLVLDAETDPGGPWHTQPAPPARSKTVAEGAGGEVDALAVTSTLLTDWRLDAPTGTWTKVATVQVPIQFGSSS